MTKEQLIEKSEYKAMVLRLLGKLTYLRKSEVYMAAYFLTELRFAGNKEEVAKRRLEAMEDGRLYPVYGKNIAQKFCDDIVDCRRIEDENF